MTEFEVDDLVWVGETREPGIVVLAAGRPPGPDAVSGSLPDVNGLCCTPLALVRTISDGRVSWVRAVDMAAPGEAGSRADGTACRTESES